MKHDDEKNAKTVTTPKDSAATKAAEPSESKRELSDDEIAAIAGGTKRIIGPGESVSP